MKKLLLLSLLILSTFSCIAQVLSVDQLVSVYNKDEEEIDAYLEERGWERSISPDPESIKTWAYGRRLAMLSMTGSDTDNPGSKYEAKGWLSLINDEDGYWLRYSIASKEQFTAIRQRIIAMGMKRVSYTSNNEEIIAVYTGARYAITLITTINGGSFSQNSYSFRLAAKD